MPGVRIVTDSAADLPAELAASRRIRVIPLTITFGSEALLDGVELPADGFWDRLRSERDIPSTAAPGPGQFEEVYRELLDEGADGIVSVHLSSKLSATWESATVAARSVHAERGVQVVDSLGVSAATALMALRAADLADDGAAPAVISAELAGYRARMHLFATVDTLEFLRRGGRIGGAAALLGTMLQMKPVITLEDGVVEACGRVRTRQKALHHLVGLVREHAGRIERLVVVHGQAQDLDTFLGLLADVTDVKQPDVWAFGPVVGTHAGPGVIGVVFVTAP